MSGYKEIFLNVYYKTKKEEGLIPADWEIAKDQLTLYSHLDNNIKVPEGNDLRVHITDSALNFENDKVQYSFSRNDGLLHQYEVGGKEFIKEGYDLKPNFWRPPTDNDYGADLQKKLINWKRASHTYTLLGFDIDSSNSKIIKLNTHLFFTGCVCLFGY